MADTFLPPSQSEEVLVPSGYAPLFITAASHDAHFAVNSRAVALMMAEFARRRVEQGKQWGRIINVSTDGSAGFLTMLLPPCPFFQVPATQTDDTPHQLMAYNEPLTSFTVL